MLSFKQASRGGAGTPTPALTAQPASPGERLCAKRTRAPTWGKTTSIRPSIQTCPSSKSFWRFEGIVGECDTNADPDIDAEPDTPRVPSIAFTNDGRVLLSLHYVEGADISDREKWTGIVLTEEERLDVLVSVADRADDAAAHVGGRLIAKARKGEPEGSGGHGRG
jgi:hypothetical protein